MAKKQPEIKTDADAAKAAEWLMRIVSRVAGHKLQQILEAAAKYARNDALEEAAAKLEEHAHAIVKAGDQFDQGGDIYSHYKPTMQAAEIVRALKVAA
jgi:hypothetical protein